MYNNLKVNIENNIATVTIDRPKALNALNEEVLSELFECFTNLSLDEKVRAIILTGEGKAFVAGADIAAMNSMNPIEGRQMMMLGHSVMNLIESIEKPVIAAVGGFALGGGCELAMACDIRIASTKAKFGQPEVGLGIIPGFGGTQRLSRLVGPGMAKLMILGGKDIMIDGQEAFRIGLVEKCVAPEELMDTCINIANSIIKAAPIAVGTAKTAINKGFNLPMQVASTLEIECFTAAFSSDDKTEGMTAFLEKRKAEFKGK